MHSPEEKPWLIYAKQHVVANAPLGYPGIATATRKPVCWLITDWLAPAVPDANLMIARRRSRVTAVTI